MAEIDSGTMAAQTPIVVPASSRVSGISATSSTMKGTARNPFTTAPTIRFSRGAGKIPPGPDVTRNTANGMPVSTAIPAETPTISTVSWNACHRRSIICGVNMAQNLSVVAQMGQRRQIGIRRCRHQNTSDLPALNAVDIGG